MDYALTRYETIRKVFRTQIRTALENFAPHRKTVLLLPGGMGSQLIRSQQPYDELPPGSNIFDTVWMDIGILLAGDGLRLEIDTADRDIGGHIIVPDGPLRYLVKAYDGTEQFFTDSKNGDYNFLVFGYDWRRPLAESAAFLEEYLDQFRRAVFERHHIDPLPKTTLLCHSQGGLVARIFMERIMNPDDWFEYVITVATPFYGTSTHQKRYYEGQAPLTLLHGAEKIAQIVATLPGPYSLMFVDRATFNQYHAAMGLEADQYPMTDADSESPIDPYSAENLDRYPSWVKPLLVENARQIRQTIAHPLPDAFAQRFFNIRSTRDKKTSTQQSWSLLPQNYDPETHELPLKTISTKGGGDGTVPHWSGWHASTPETNRINLTKARDHGTLAENEETLHIVKQIIDTGSHIDAVVGKNRIYAQKRKPADSEALDIFLKDVREGRINREDPRAYDPSIWRGLYLEMKR